ncbi:unnamed protein product [Spodoptera exigua]|uniref:BZIP domain-containing protein n=1 Tax=Spodoptera exigua TaxID=7107 RepID=A0A922MSZ1_SPOEX|nr:hypothetical protein HF086_007357 [Spodoptera exigua]CAH0686510.1 unnamed protein product [Spodoptera exigua]
MSIWRPYLEDVATDDPLNLAVTQVSQSDAVSVTYPACLSNLAYPEYLAVPPQHYGPAWMSPGQYGYYQFASAPSPSPSPVLAPPAAVSPPKSSPADYEDAEISEDEDFQLFKKISMDAMAMRNGGTILASNPRMRRTVRSAAEDDAYRRTREKNNAAAKQSRDRRKLREIHLSLKVTYLKRQLATLKAALGSQTCTRCHRSTLN